MKNRINHNNLLKANPNTEKENFPQFSTKKIYYEEEGAWEWCTAHDYDGTTFICMSHVKLSQNAIYKFECQGELREQK